MEPVEAKMKIYLGEFKVVQADPLGAITLNIGRNVHVTIHLGDFPHTVKTGDTLPLYTEVPHAYTGQTSIQ